MRALRRRMEAYFACFLVALAAGGMMRTVMLALHREPPAQAHVQLVAQPTIDALPYLSHGVWRAGESPADCQSRTLFQRFEAAPEGARVEIGAGAPGQGERLEILIARATSGFIDLETRVCAPIGCSRTQERWKISGENLMHEWDFVGRDGDRPPYVLVKNGLQKDGKPARAFTRCPA